MKSVSIQIIVAFLFIFSVQSIYAQRKVVKTEKEWKETLSPMQYYVLRQKGTERATTGIYDKHYEEGIYVCAGCATPLFNSENKYNSHSGWPSYDRYIKNNVNKIEDNSHGMKRTEVVCNVCDGHLGHVFNDGPRETTGKRYCINSASLKFISKK